VPLREVASKQRGDLGQKVFYDAEPIKILVPCGSEAKQTYTNGIANEGCVRWFENPSAPVKTTALVMHDSFTMWLFDILAAIFSRVMFVHSTIFDFELMTRLRPQYVFCIQAERFFVRPPTDGNSVLEFIQRQESLKHSTSSFDQWLDQMLESDQRP
jgi:hypothetical protein